ncbi:MAG: hypothetical protein AB8D78_06855 [Akkermansiaceae bacterium]
MKNFLKWGWLCALFFVVSCGERESSVENTESSSENGLAADSEVEVDLGFAARVPADSDFFFAAYYDGEEFIEGVMEWMEDFGIAEVVEADLDGSDLDELAEIEAKLNEAADYMGTEVFAFSGPGVGSKLEMIGTTYREFSGAWAGFVVGGVLDAMAEEGRDLDFERLSNSLSGDLLERWFSVIEKESRLLVPSVVVGWRPGEPKLEESKAATRKMLDELFKGEEGADAMSFESNGAEMSGYEVKGTDVFGDFVEEMRGALDAKADEFDLGGGLSAERLEQFLVALESVKFTIATGVVDGRVLIYFGDGADGFVLAENADESLASREDFKWMAPPSGKELVATAYLSETMVGSVLPWLDTSGFWESIAEAVTEPVVNQRLMRELLMGLSSNSKDLSVRDISSWSGAAYVGDGGWSMQTRGGIVDPSIDFGTPFQMLGAVDSMKPAFRAHWVQNRGWENLSWKKVEYFGFLVEAVANEVAKVFETEIKAVPGTDGVMERLAETANKLNEAYREQFRSGIGDEVAFFGDFLGEVPPVPGIAQETVENFTVPRFIYARPMVDRELVSKAGDSAEKIWRDTVAYANSFGSGGIPLILPQAIESDEMVTWFVPLPFIGGDFVPGVTLGDDTWMIGTSRSLASGLADALSKKNESLEKGVLVEVEFDAIGSWLRDVYENGKDQADSLVDEELDVETMKQVEESSKAFFDRFSKLKSLKYRHWLESDKPRKSLDLEFESK